MVKILSFLFVVLAVMVIISFLGKLGTGGFKDIRSTLISVLTFSLTFGFVIVSLGSFSGFARSMQSLFGGLPFLDKLENYGSLSNLVEKAPLEAVTAFCDAVLLSTLIQLIQMLFPMQRNSGKTFTVCLLTSFAVLICALLLLNRVLKPSALYRWISTTTGSVIVLIALISIPVSLIAASKKNAKGSFGAALLYSKSEAVGIFRTALLQALVYVGGILFLEKNYGSLTQGMSALSVMLSAILPLVIMLFGLGIMLSSLQRH